MASFNLIDRRWIPCLYLDGKQDELSLDDTLVQAHQIREIRGDSPLETVSLLRLILVILYRVCDLHGRSDWYELWRRGRFDPHQLQAYFFRWRHRFDLLDAQQPFYQVADESQLGERGPLNKIVHHIASDNSATLFEHTMADRKNPVLFTPAQAARALITTQYFALGFQRFVRGPCASGVNCLISGVNLFETMLLNLYPKSLVESAIPSTADDRPIWESETGYADRKTPDGLCDYLTWPNRKIKLFLNLDKTAIETVAWAPGLRLQDGVTDPMQRHWVDEQGGWRELRFDPERALWRDSAVLLELSSDSAKSRPVAAVDWLGRLARQYPELRNKAYRLVAFGMCSHQAEILYLRAEATPLSGELLQNDTLVGELGTALELADKVAGRIRMAVFNLARLLLKPQTSDQETTDDKTREKMRRSRSESRDDEAKRVGMLAQSWCAEPFYWSQLEPHFNTLVNDLPLGSEAALAEWRDQLRRAARGAFARAEDAVASDVRAARALAVAGDQFDAGVSHLLSVPKSANTTQGGDNP